MSALNLDSDNVIIGGGVAGLAASLRLPGRTILLSRGLGATALSTGVLSSALRDPKVENWFLHIMEKTACPYARGKCATISKAVREGLVQKSTLCEGKPMFIAVNEIRPGFRNIEFMKGSSLQEIARILETDDHAIEALCRSLADVKAERILIPPILGITRVQELQKKLSDSLGIEVGEYVAAPSALGTRLIHALRKEAAKNERVELLDIVEINKVVSGHVEGTMGTKGKREIRVGADNLFIATGGPLTGFMVEGDRMFEPLTGATVTRDFEADFNTEFLSDHPLMNKGIEPEPYIHGFSNVRAIGATSCGFGLYRALVSGYHAGDSL